MRSSARDREIASLDSLTGVMGRRAGLLALDREVTRAERTQQALLVGFVDVDHLKRVNDDRGHEAGDQVLIGVAVALRDNTRPYDLIFRYGGDEFVCAFPAVAAAFGESWAARVNSELVATSGGASVTVGFAELRPSEDGPQLLARADEALYRLRQHDRDRVPPPRV